MDKKNCNIYTIARDREWLPLSLDIFASFTIEI